MKVAEQIGDALQPVFRLEMTDDDEDFCQLYTVSLLIIILEQQDKESGSEQTSINTKNHAADHCLSVPACAQRVVEAVTGFINAGEDRNRMIKDKDFHDQVASAYETLAVASDQLFIQAQRYDSRHTSENSKHALCQAAKDVLQGVLQVLLLNDDQYVRQLLQKTDSVLSLIREVESVRELSDLLPAFKAITYAVLVVKMELMRRCRDLCSKSCRDELMIWAGVLQKCIPSLSKSCQSCLKYRNNITAEVTRSSVVQEIFQACSKIKQLLQSGPQDEVEDGVSSFVAMVEKVIDSLSEVNCGTLNPDMESDILHLVHHSMAVAHCTQSIYRGMIVSSCHRILQSKFQLLELYATMRQKPTLVQIRSDYESVCEIIRDEVCDLEKHVNVTLMHLIIETFLCPLEKMATLKDVAGFKRINKQQVDYQDNLVAEFTEFTENLCQVSLLVAASSTDSTKMREIVTSVRCLESIDPDIGPAVLSVRKDPKNPAAKKYLDLVLGRWAQEVCTIVNTVDAMIDPKVFMTMTENMLTQHIDAFKTMHGCPHSDVRHHFFKFIHLCQRPGVLARKLMDENSDPVYRNGLQYFVTVLFQRVKEAKNVYMEVMQTEEPPQLQYDTLERRMKLVIQAVRGLREGLDVKTHPHLLSHKRVMFQQRGLHLRQEQKIDHRETKTGMKAQISQAHQKVVQSENGNLPEASNTSKQSPDPHSNGVPPRADPELLVNLSEVFDKKELEEGPSSEIYQIAKSLLSACEPPDHRLAEDMTHNLLSWTSHITDNAKSLMTHFSDIPEMNQLKDLVQKIDQTTPEIVQKIKFVMAGERALLHELVKDTVEWVRLMNAARVIIDATVSSWLNLTRDIRWTVEANDEQQLKILMSGIHNAEKGMCQLLLKTRLLSGKYVENGVEKVEFLLESHNEIENLTFTIKTSVDVAMVSAKRSPPDWWQLAMACRDWSIAMSCAHSELDIISEKMELLGQKRFRGFQIENVKKISKMAAVLQEETDCILQLVDCVVVGDSTLKARSDDLVSHLRSALSDVCDAAKQPVTDKDMSLDGHFSKMKFNLAKSKWIEKATEVQDMIRNNCYEYFGFAHQFLLSAQELCNEDLQNELKTRKRHELGGLFLERSQYLKQHVLRAIQVCPDLSRRTVVRSTLDTLSKLTTQTEGLIRTSPSLTHADVSSLSEQWAARIKKLVFNLKRMEGVKPSLVSEIERFNKSSFGLYQHEASSQHQQVHLLELPVQHQRYQQNNHPWCCQSQNIPQLLQETCNTSSVPLQQSSGMLLPICGKTHSRNASGDILVSSPGDNSVQGVLSDAKYLGYRLQKWQDNENSVAASQELKVTQSAIEMANLCSEMALFTTGQGSMKTSEEVNGAADVIVRHSRYLERFARRLLSLTGSGRHADSLKVCISRINTCASQLHVISTVLHNSSKSFQGDRILVKNAQNLVSAVRQMFSVVETLAVKGVQDPAAEDETTKEVTALLRRIQFENEQYIKDERNAIQVDDLGLRRVESHNPPTLTSLVDLKASIQSFEREQLKDD